MMAVPTRAEVAIAVGLEGFPAVTWSASESVDGFLSISATRHGYTAKASIPPGCSFAEWAERLTKLALAVSFPYDTPTKDQPIVLDWSA